MLVRNPDYVTAGGDARGKLIHAERLENGSLLEVRVNQYNRRGFKIATLIDDEVVSAANVAASEMGTTVTSWHTDKVIDARKDYRIKFITDTEGMWDVFTGGIGKFMSIEKSSVNEIVVALTKEEARDVKDLSAVLSIKEITDA